MDIAKQIEEYELKYKGIEIAYGGDGEVLEAVARTNGKKSIFPFRNYSLCDDHLHRLEEFLSGKEGQKDLKITRCPFIEWRNVSLSEVQTVNGSKMPMMKTMVSASGEELKGKGIAEVAFKAANITEALRFNVYVDDKLYMKNAVADGAIVSTVYGATGYFKSITRCIFNGNNIGIAFIAPTQGINNLILDNKTKVRFEFLRDAEIAVSADKMCKKLSICKGKCIEVQEIPDAVSIFGLSEFHCFKCREKRHSITEAGIAVQDQYTIA